jgi:hypothetical protein
MARSDTALS